MMRLFAAAGFGLMLGIGGAYIPAPTVLAPLFDAGAPKPVRVLFGGDIMLDRNVARTAEAEGGGALFANIVETFRDSDIRIANLEGTITSNPSVAKQDNTILRFTFDPIVAGEALRPLALSAVSLANNHTLDFYDAGYKQTRQEVEALGVSPFGHPLNTAGSLSSAVEFESKTLCFVGYHSLYTASTKTVVEEISSLRDTCWRIVVMAHWGEEYVHTANDAQRSAAHAFVDAGADLVVGAHPHVVQDAEVYRGAAIFYSLGNFMFDQNFSWGTTHSMLLRADFSDTTTRFFIIPTTVADQKTGLAVGDESQKILDIVGARLPGGPVAEFSLP